MSHVQRQAASLDREAFDNLLAKYAAAYYNNSANDDVLPDAIWDDLIDMYEEKFKCKYTCIGANPTTNKNPNSTDTKHHHTPPVWQTKIELPLYMGSLDKAKTVPSMLSWAHNKPGPYIITDKIDGVSALTNGFDCMYTRGNGKIGTDITHLMKPLLSKNHDITIKPPQATNTWIRGEIVMLRETFQRKYAATQSNCRNMVSGIVNSKMPSKEQVQDLCFIAYTIIHVSNKTTTTLSTPQQQLVKLRELGYQTPDYEFVLAEIKDEVTVTQELQEQLERRRKDSPYDVDGLVVAQNITHDLMMASNNPDHVIAYKCDSNHLDTVVEAVEWNTSKHGLLKPRVKIAPVHLCGVVINYCTGFNAQFILENKIGPGARVRVTRAGEVIPQITKVLKPSTHGAQMPGVENKDWEWFRRRHIALDNKEEYQHQHCTIERHDNQNYRVWYEESSVDIVQCSNGDKSNTNATTPWSSKQLANFFHVLNAKHLGESTVKKMVANKIDTLAKFLNVTEGELLGVPGIKDKSAKRICAAIAASTTNVPIATLAAASGIFGIGIGARQLEKIERQVPEFFASVVVTDKKSQQQQPQPLPAAHFITVIQALGGFKERAVQIVSSLSNFKSFLKAHSKITYVTIQEQKKATAKATKTAKAATTAKKTKTTNSTSQQKRKQSDDDNDTGMTSSSSIQDMTIVFTGFRDVALERLIIDRGGKVSTSVSSKTSLVVHGDCDSAVAPGVKASKARELGVKLTPIAVFKQQFL